MGNVFVKKLLIGWAAPDQRINKVTSTSNL